MAHHNYQISGNYVVAFSRSPNTVQLVLLYLRYTVICRNFNAHISVHSRASSSKSEMGFTQLHNSSYCVVCYPLKVSTNMVCQMLALRPFPSLEI